MASATSVTNLSSASGVLEFASSSFETFQDAFLDVINKDSYLTKNPQLLENIRTFITSLCEKSSASIEGTDSYCRPIAVTAQGAIETALAKMLHSRELDFVQAVFLTPLPATPLRKQGSTPNLTKEPFEAARQYTLDLREHTVRALRAAGATLVVTYSESELQTFASDPKNQEAMTVWNQECQVLGTKSVSLAKPVPAELVGALYLIKDKEGNSFYLCTQGIQAQDAKPGVWKKWISSKSESNEGTERANKMMRFIEENSTCKF